MTFRVGGNCKEIKCHLFCEHKEDWAIKRNHQSVRARSGLCRKAGSLSMCHPSLTPQLSQASPAQTSSPTSADSEPGFTWLMKMPGFWMGPLEMLWEVGKAGDSLPLLVLCYACHPLLGRPVFRKPLSHKAPTLSHSQPAVHCCAGQQPQSTVCNPPIRPLT